MRPLSGSLATLLAALVLCVFLAATPGLAQTPAASGLPVTESETQALSTRQQAGLFLGAAADQVASVSIDADEDGSVWRAVLAFRPIPAIDGGMVHVGGVCAVQHLAITLDFVAGLDRVEEVDAYLRHVLIGQPTLKIESQWSPEDADHLARRRACDAADPATPIIFAGSALDIYLAVYTVEALPDILATRPADLSCEQSGQPCAAELPALVAAATLRLTTSCLSDDAVAIRAGDDDEVCTSALYAVGGGDARVADWRVIAVGPYPQAGEAFNPARVLIEQTDSPIP